VGPQVAGRGREHGQRAHGEAKLTRLAPQTPSATVAVLVSGVLWPVIVAQHRCQGSPFPLLWCSNQRQAVSICYTWLWDAAAPARRHIDSARCPLSCPRVLLQFASVRAHSNGKRYCEVYRYSTLQLDPGIPALPRVYPATTPETLKEGVYPAGYTVVLLYRSDSCRDASGG
jgi:hypothetical protein